MLDGIRQELRRVEARDMLVSLDDEFDPSVGTLVKVVHDGKYWHLFPDGFAQLLSELPDGSGSHAVSERIELKALPVWHGPSPKNTRE
jgi:hypothetical protein